MSIRAPFALLLLFVFIVPELAWGQSGSFKKMSKEAERYYSRGSYTKAGEVYTKIKKLRLNQAQARWVEFRLADTTWRSAAQSHRHDSSKFDAAASALQKLQQEAPQQKQIYAEISESLGDLYWTPRRRRNWHSAQTHYNLALNWWASQEASEKARKRYLAIVWRISKPPHAQPYYYYGYHGNLLSIDLINNAIKLARSADEKAHANYLLAMTINRYGHAAQAQIAKEAFEKALRTGKETDWYDDALFHYAQWTENQHTLKVRIDEHERQYPDFVQAVNLYRRLIREFRKGETRYYDQAVNRINNITDPRLSLSVSNAFYPGSEVQYQVSWRNISRISFQLYRVSLTADVRFAGSENRGASWLKELQLSSKSPYRSWSYDTNDKGIHIHQNKQLHLAETLPAGAYVLTAQAGDKQVRDLVLVSSASVLLHASGKKALVFFADAESGAPISNAEVVLWEQYEYRGLLFGRSRTHYAWHSHTAVTDKDGLAVFELRNTKSSSYLYAAAGSDNTQAFSVIRNHYHHRDQGNWKVYVYTDRPAYRPEDSVKWKVVARYHDGYNYSTPTGQSIQYRISDPRGTEIKKGSFKLNAFGSAWDSLNLGASLPLGQYQISFRTADNNSHIGSASLFRLEEYKLPEYKVTVAAPVVDGKRKSFRVGEAVESDISASYYFGGAVADANVEVVVYQKPFYHFWAPPREFPWFFDDSSRHRRHQYYGQGQVIKRETLRTDASGKARITFDTPSGVNQDFEYRIEARVTDSSRREVVGSDFVRVTRQPYFVYPRSEHNIYHPKDRVEVTFRALDANSQPVEKTGRVVVTRDYHSEVWLAPNGREYTGYELDEIRKRSDVFPPPPSPQRPNERWKRIRWGYEHEEILSETLTTDANGEAVLRFTPGRDGYFRAKWTSEEKTTTVVTGETMVWVADNKSTELGYRKGGLEIIVDKDSFKVGENAPVMLHTPVSNRYVLFLVEGAELYHHQLVHVSGTVKLLNLDIADEHVPNVFLNASMVHSGRLHQDTKDIVVPPTKHFLDVTVTPDRPQYEPGQKGTFTITAHDHNGKPAVAELGVALFDESVLYIQQEYAQDPRKFFYGTKRHRRSSFRSTFQQKHFLRLAKDKGGRIVPLEALHDDRDRVNYAVGSGKAEPMVQLQAAGEMMEMEASADSLGGVSEMKSSGARREKRRAFAQTAAAPASAPGGGGAAADEPAVVVRSDFRATALWVPSVQTDLNGKATVEVTYPDSLTTWKAAVRANSTQADFGVASGETKTNKPLIVRLQAPRFFVVGDEVTLSAVINNNSEEELRVSPALKVEGLAPASKKPAAPLLIPAGGEERVDWLMKAETEGTARVRVAAKSSTLADAMEKSYQVHRHGIDKFVAAAGKLRGKQAGAELFVPKERKKESTEFIIQVSPSLAVTMLDALPYLIDYPYGCTEQTMSRFLPTLIVAKTLADMGLNPEEAATRVFGGIEREHVEKTQPKGKKNLSEIRKMSVKGLRRLYDFQHSDGGWGWWKEGDSDHYMTAYVLWGLSLASRSGVDIRPKVMSRANEYLNRELVEEEEHLDMQAWMLHAGAAYQNVLTPYSPKKRMSRYQQKAFNNLWKRRDALNAYTRALLALTAHYFGESDKALILIENLENGVIRDDAPDQSAIQKVSDKANTGRMSTAHWGEDGVYWRWSEGGVEATAFALRALVAIEPEHHLIEPVTNWLIKNRRGAQWSNTRDTAIVVLALNDYLKASGELGSDLSYTVELNGRTLERRSVSKSDILRAPGMITVDPELIRDGKNVVRIVRQQGSGPLYFSAQATYFSLEEPIPAEAHELFVRREFYKLTPKQTLLKGVTLDKTLLEDGAELTSGDRVEVVVVVETKNNYEYLVFEDMKAAGLEAVKLKSGERMYARQLRQDAVERRYGKDAAPASREKKPAGVFENNPGRRLFSQSRPHHPEPEAANPDLTGQSRWVYQELRDRKVAMFIDKLPEGVWEMRYELRAEVPGKFHALPLMAHAMYVPEIKANSNEIRLVVQDRPDAEPESDISDGSVD